MSEVTATAAPAVLTVGAPSAAPSPAPSQAQNNPSDPNAEPTWLAGRLERERKQVLKDLGIDNADELKQLIADQKAVKDAAKSDAQKRGELETTLASERAKITELNEALGALAQGQMASLTEAQRNAVAGIAGNDPAKQIKTIEALRSTWASTSAPAPAAPEPPRQTAAQPNAPASVTTTSSPVDHKAIWAELKDVNPVAASRYALENGIFNSK